MEYVCDLAVRCKNLFVFLQSKLRPRLNASMNLSPAIPALHIILPIQEIASYLGISRRQLHRIREAESAADASECEDI